MVTIKDIAKRANVSVATVSYILNDTKQVSDETKKRVMDIVEELNYRPNRIAKSLRLNKTHTIGILVEDITVFFVPGIINGINEFAENNGYHIILNDLHLVDKLENKFDELIHYKKKVNEGVELLLSAQVDGIIYIGLHDRNVGGIIEEIDKPLVFAYCYTDKEEDVYVTYENEAIAYEATQYLIDRGHKKIGVISGHINSVPSHKRLLGYQKALMNNGLNYDFQNIKIGNWKYDFGYKMAIELLSIPDRPTAIFAMNDLMAVGVMDAASYLGLSIPKDLSIIGFDDREVASFTRPKLTTIKLPLQQIGYTAGDLLYKVINNIKIEEHGYKLSCQLIERETVRQNTE